MVEEKQTYVEEITPSGIEIRYHWEPKRMYELRQPEFSVKTEEGMKPVSREWREVPSVTTVLDIMNKPALPWWGMEVGVKGVLQLQHYPEVDWDSLKHADPAGVTKLLTKHKLTVNHVRDEAAGRGKSVHSAMEAWAKSGTIPDPSIFPHEEQGYVKGLVKFLKDLPDLEVEGVEVMVGSLEHGFAGRYDMRVKLPTARAVCKRHTPVRGEQMANLEPGTFLIDLKTSKHVYLGHHRQLAAYELASVESGYEPTDAQAILHVTAEGTYEFVRSLALGEDFCYALALYKSECQLKERK